MSHVAPGVPCSREIPIPEACIDQLVFSQASLSPSAIAIEYEETTVTYGELARRADLIAQLLRARGVGRDSVVGVMVERSPEMVVAVLGILRSGAAYLPLESSYPRDRLRYMLDQSGAKLLITRQALAELVHPLAIDCLFVDSATAPDIEPDAERGGRSPFDLAYVMFTSGSTGEPKGVLVPHRGVVNRLVWMQNAFGIQAADRILQKTPLGFDVSVWELFVPLICGARLVLAASGRHADAKYLARLMIEKAVTIAHFVPSMLRSFLDIAGGALGTAPLKHVICSGEALAPALAEDFFARASAELHNHYGPTEASIEVTTWRCRRGDLTVPIGFPIQNVQVQILDEQERPVEDGQIGELFLGGVCLARGYAGRPDLTAAQFREVTIHPHRTLRMYKTGDLVRRNAEGAIEFLGRKDTQVKIRGYRVELAEIEHHLERHACVQKALVMAQAEQDARLICYVSPRPGAAISMSELRSHCEAYLPRYMWPADFFVVSAFPQTQSGKLDRKAFIASLSPQQAEQGDSSGGFDEPNTPTEIEVAAVWSEFTGTDVIGRHDNFFWIGGSSLVLVQVLSELSWKFGVDLDLVGMMDYLTVSSLARQIDYQLAALGENDSALSPRQTVRSQPIPLSLTQERILILEQTGVVGPLFVIPSVWQLSGSLDVPAMVRAVQEIVRRHEILRTRFALAASGPQQVIEAQTDFTVQIEDLSSMAQQERDAWLERRLANEATRVMSLEKGPLFRATLLVCSPSEHILVFSVHHIVSDGWSLMTVLPRELTALYGAFAEDKPAPLKELTVQYAQYACWQRAWLQTDSARRELDYWRAALKDVPTVLDLPTDYPRSTRPSFRGSSLRFEFSPVLSRRIVDLAKRERATAFMVLLAGCQLVLSRWSGQKDFLVGSTNAGRWSRDLEGLIGCFITTMILRANLAGEATFCHLIARVKQCVIDAFSHRYVPLERLIAELQPQRELSRNPLFQVAVNLHNAPVSRLELRGLEARALTIEGQASKLDLSIHFFEAPEAFVGYVEYSIDLFAASTIRAFLNHLEAALDHATAEPERPLWQLSSMPTPKRVAVSSAAAGESLAELFEEQVRQRPGAIAVRDRLSTVTYEALDERATAVANTILGNLSQSQSRIGLLFEPSVEMIVAILGVLKAGHAYVPLDPGFPKDRLRQILADCDSQLLLTSGKLAPSARELHPSRPVIVIDALERAKTCAAAARRTGEDLTYILYTSGSTGRPKGVYQNDRNVAHFARAYASSLGVKPEDRLTLLPSYAFDAAVMDIFGSLLTGASLHIFDVRSRPLAELGAWIRESAITIWHSTPTLLRLASWSVSANDSTSVRYAVLGGEEAAPSDVRVARETFGSTCVLVNGYGPTESTVTTQYFAREDRDEARARLPIGHPIAGAELFMVDDLGRQTQLRGELCIAEEHLALGYWGDSALSEQRFCMDSIRGRYYRTGDLVRQLGDGSFEYLGRIDDQVKIRGYRVELAEVESVMRTHPDVLHASAFTTRTVQANLVLAAVVVRESGSLQTKDLLSFLKSRLPAYAIPAQLFTASALPLLPNGKVDRRALSLASNAPTDAIVGEAPAADTEHLLVEVWSTVLQRTGIGTDQDFFELGGDSLLAMWMFAGVQERTGAKLSLFDLLEAPTIAELARRLDRSPEARLQPAE